LRSHPPCGNRNREICPAPCSKKILDAGAGPGKPLLFTSFEGRRERDPKPGEFSLPATLEMQGDFSRTVAIVGGQPQVIQVFDPWTTRLETGRYIRQPFAGNAVPAWRFSPSHKRRSSSTPNRTAPAIPSAGGRTTGSRTLPSTAGMFSLRARTTTSAARIALGEDGRRSGRTGCHGFQKLTSACALRFVHGSYAPVEMSSALSLSITRPL